MLNALCVIAGLMLLLTMFVGYMGYFGPFKWLTVLRIWISYWHRPKGEIVFYGASNFFLWRKLEADMKPLAVQNHGFGGSMDRDLMKHAKTLLYPYQPKITVFQSGSNDFGLGLTVEDVYANKDKMYTMLRNKLPDTPFVVMSMLPLPGRAENWPDSVKINQYLRDYCLNHKKMFFVDATDILMTREGNFRPELFRRDGIHLNRDGQLLWGALIKNAIERVMQDEKN